MKFNAYAWSILGLLVSYTGPASAGPTSAQPQLDEILPISIGTYNVENFWDGNATNSSNPYDDYSCSSSNWISENMAAVKAQSIAEAIRLAGYPDVLGLQEIESAGNKSESLHLLMPLLASAGYRYHALGEQPENNPTVVTTAVVSKFPIVKNERVDFPGDDSDRDPQVATIDINGTHLRLYVNHWKSKRGGNGEITEARRMAVARLVHKDIMKARKIQPSLDVIVLGDFNSDYNETQIQKIPESGIVDGLGVTGDERMMLNENNNRLYNLWFDLPVEKRGSYPFNNSLTAIDSILITDSLYDKSGIQYRPKSFRVVGHETGSEAAEKLLNADGSPFRWQVVREVSADTSYTRHIGLGYSDHLPLVADFIAIKGAGNSDKIELAKPSITEFGPTMVAPLVLQPCVHRQAVELNHLTPPLEKGACVMYRGTPVQISREGQYGVKIQVGNSWYGLSMSYPYGRNKRFQREVLQQAVGKNITYIKGHIGYQDGRLAIFANAANDITIE